MHKSTILAAAAALPLCAFAQVDFTVQPKCPKGVQIITSCGTGQSDYGTIEGLTDSIKNSIDGSASVALQYPAALIPTYPYSVNAGVQNLTKYIEYFVNGCPNIKLVLLGYSQGAQVTLTTICGWQTGLYNFQAWPALPVQYRDNIVAIVGYGDPTHITPTSYDKGNSTHDGLFPRELGECAFVSNKIASWCDHGDQFCDNCPPPASPDAPNPRGCDKNVHQSYWDIYNDAATSWVQQKHAAFIGAPGLIYPSSTSSSTKHKPTRTGTGSSTATGTATAATATATSAAGRLQPPWPLLSIARLLRAQR